MTHPQSAAVEFKRIYLSPKCENCNDGNERTWCEDDQGPCDCGREWVPYNLDTSAILSHLSTLQTQADQLAIANAKIERLEAIEVAARNFIELGKCDLSNPKYDGYFMLLADAIRAAIFPGEA